MTDHSGEWISAGVADSIRSQQAAEIVVAGRIIAVFFHDEQFHAMDGMCAHQGGPLAKGIVEHNCVTCPWHGWQYELDSGIQTVNRQPLQQIYPTRVRDGVLELMIE